VGDPADPVTRIGPLVSAAQRQRGENYIAAGRAEGGRIAADGGRPAHLDRGWYIEPTVFADLDPAATLAREEVFGPVLAVLPYDTFDDAIRIANDSEYALGGTIWTSDEERGLDLARRVQAGSVGVNFFNLDLGFRLRRGQGQRRWPRARPGGPGRLRLVQVDLHPGLAT